MKKVLVFAAHPDDELLGMGGTVGRLVAGYIEKYRPDTVFTHHHDDLNVDHRITCEAVLMACRPVDAFETPSSSEWEFVARANPGEYRTDRIIRYFGSCCQVMAS